MKPCKITIEINELPELGFTRQISAKVMAADGRYFNFPGEPRRFDEDTPLPMLMQIFMMQLEVTIETLL